MVLPCSDLLPLLCLRGIVWKVFSRMENLKTIQIDGLPVPTIGKDFNQNVPHKLKELDFRNTKTKKFEKGTFALFYRF